MGGGVLDKQFLAENSSIQHNGRNCESDAQTQSSLGRRVVLMSSGPSTEYAANIALSTPPLISQCLCRCASASARTRCPTSSTSERNTPSRYAKRRPPCPRGRTDWFFLSGLCARRTLTPFRRSSSRRFFSFFILERDHTNHPPPNLVRLSPETVLLRQGPSGRRFVRPGA